MPVILILNIYVKIHPDIILLFIMHPPPGVLCLIFANIIYFFYQLIARQTS